jgi:hypothetical protein
MAEIYNLRASLASRAGLSPQKQDRAGIVARLVALNATRAAEEKSGHIRWLRPDYQIPRFGAKSGETGGGADDSR